jgi:hypothetical protein
MKLLRAALLFPALIATTAATPPEFDGVMTSQGTIYFALREDPTVATKWIKLGDNIGGYVAKSYDKNRGAFTRERWS